MTLGFSTKINGKPTYFPEKIWKGLPAILPDDNIFDCERHRFGAKNVTFDSGKLTVDLSIDIKPKLHTIRYDKTDRWKAGMKIHPVINNRTPNRYQFAEGMVCKSVQQINIRLRNDLPMTSDIQRFGYRLKATVRGMDFYNFYHVVVDGNLLEGAAIELLAINDGFDNADDFFNWFRDDFEGKIIHWTDLKY